MAAVKGLHELSGLEVIKENTIVTAYPQGVVDGIISQSADKQRQSGLVFCHRHALYGTGGEIDHVQSPTPGTRPQTSLMIGHQG